MGKLAVFFAEGYEEIEALTVVDICRRCGLEVDMVAVPGAAQADGTADRHGASQDGAAALLVKGSHNVAVRMDKTIEQLNFDEYDMLVLPGGKLGTENLEAHEGLMAQVDTLNSGCPYESPSNKSFKMDTCCLEDGTEVNLTWPQVNIVAGDYGVVTAINFLSMGWRCKGNYTACYPSNTDVKDMFTPVSRMFDWVGNTLIRTFWIKLDKPMNRRLIDNILDTSNIWLSGLVGTERLLGARAEMIAEENNLLDLMAGILHIHIYITPPSPMQQCDFILEYDTSYVESALAA